jgi:NAD(P)H-flavin reductase
VEIFNGEWNIFLWPSLSIWLFDRLLRALRILAFNWRFWSKNCEVTYNSHSNLVRLEVPCSQSFLEPKPGSYYYIYALDNLLYAHQSHPFTLAYVASNEDDEDLELRTRTSSPSSTASTESSESEALLPHKPTSSNSPSSSLVFLIRPYDGFTSRLALSSTHTPSSLRVLLEGPYGSTAPLRTFSTILFLVGGTGIAAPLSYLTHLLSSPSSRVRRLRIVWAVREHAFFVDVLARFKELLRDERVEVDVHVTRDEEGKDDPVAEGLEGVGLLAGRPDVDAEVEEICRGSGGRDVRTAVVACGPSMMADQTRRACVRAIGDGYRSVEYFEESFKW